MQIEQTYTEPSARAMGVREAKAHLDDLHEGRLSLTERQRLVTDLLTEGRWDGQVQAVAEALGSGHFAAITLDAVHNDLMSGFEAVEATWKGVSATVPLSDFRPHNVSVLGGQGVLPKVLEKESYKEVEVKDELRTPLTAEKYGAIASFSLEAHMNAEIANLREYGSEFGKAAPLTINEKVFNQLIMTNANIWDGVALFHEGSHANDPSGGSSVSLNATNMKAAIAKFGQQTGLAGQKIKLRPRFLICGPSLELDAEELLGSASYIAAQMPTAAVDFRGQMNAIGRRMAATPVVSEWITDDSWFLCSDPAIRPTIKVGLLDNREEPEIWMEPQNTGAWFLNDATRVKARIAFDAEVVDYRTIVRGSAS